MFTNDRFKFVLVVEHWWFDGGLDKVMDQDIVNICLKPRIEESSFKISRLLEKESSVKNEESSVYFGCFRIVKTR